MTTREVTTKGGQTISVEVRTLVDPYSFRVIEYYLLPADQSHRLLFWLRSLAKPIGIKGYGEHNGNFLLAKRGSIKIGDASYPWEVLDIKRAMFLNITCTDDEAITVYTMNSSSSVYVTADIVVPGYIIKVCNGFMRIYSSKDVKLGEKYLMMADCNRVELVAKERGLRPELIEAGRPKKDGTISLLRAECRLYHDKDTVYNIEHCASSACLWTVIQLIDAKYVRCSAVLLSGLDLPATQWDAVPQDDEIVLLCKLECEGPV